MGRDPSSFLVVSGGLGGSASAADCASQHRHPVCGRHGSGLTLGFRTLDPQTTPRRISTAWPAEGTRLTEMCTAPPGICSPSRGRRLPTGRFHLVGKSTTSSSLNGPPCSTTSRPWPGCRASGATWTSSSATGISAGTGATSESPTPGWLVDARGRHQGLRPRGTLTGASAISGGPLSHGFDSYFGDDATNWAPYARFVDDRVITELTEPLSITPRTAEGSWEARPGPMTKGWDFYAVIPPPHGTGGRVDRPSARCGRAVLPLRAVWSNSPHARIVPTVELRRDVAARRLWRLHGADRRRGRSHPPGPGRQRVRREHARGLRGR